MKFIIKCFLIIVVFLISSCKSTSNTVEAGKLPILAICPIEEVSPSIDGENKNEIEQNGFDFFVEPTNVEESEDNIIVIETDVPADVYLNNTFMGQSNIEIEGLIPGNFILELKKEGYENCKYFITSGKNRKNFYYFNMKCKE